MAPLNVNITYLLVDAGINNKKKCKLTIRFDTFNRVST